MNWIANFIRPRIKGLTKGAPAPATAATPDNLWRKCPGCGEMIFHRDLVSAENVCPRCGHHLRIGARERFEALLDLNTAEPLAAPQVPQDPLKFRDDRRYADRLKDARTKTSQDDALSAARGRLDGIPVVMAVQSFDFMGGSLGLATGEALVHAMQVAVAEKRPFILIVSSGGARMQEGILSLMQMPRTTVGVDMLREAGLPYIVVLTDPTTGGVSASYAMLGDVQIAEPGALIGFSGPRVIEQTIRERLPDGFQRAEYLLDHGMIDMIVHRHQLKPTLSRLLQLMLKRPASRPALTNGQLNGQANGPDEQSGPRAGHSLQPTLGMNQLPAPSEAVLERLLKLHPKRIDLVLERIERLLAALGHPERKLPPVFHIAGTNGKGSVCAYLRAIMEANGKRVHVYTSPHLVHFHERVRLAGKLISEDELAATLLECERANAAAPITFFEITTAAAILAFSRVPADATILEVGLGGRFDATNVIARPRVTCFTPVALDHQEFLGSDLGAYRLGKGRHPETRRARHRRPAKRNRARRHRLRGRQDRRARLRLRPGFRRPRRTRASGLSGRKRPARSAAAQAARPPSDRQRRHRHRRAAPRGRGLGARQRDRTRAACRRMARAHAAPAKGPLSRPRPRAPRSGSTAGTIRIARRRWPRPWPISKSVRPSRSISSAAC